MQTYTKDGINEVTYDLLFSDGEFKSPHEYGSDLNHIIIRLIEEYTKDNRNKAIQRIFGRKIRFLRFSYDKKTGIHTLTSKNEFSIPFELISENLDGISITLKEELESSERLHQCHKRSIGIGLGLPGSKVITGIIKLGKRHYLHSVVEAIGSETGKVKIIDYTRNLIIEKDLYYKLFSFRPLTEIESYHFLDDLETLKQAGLEDISSKVFLTFHDEIVNDINKRLIKAKN